jgi:hypothetical protein
MDPAMIKALAAALLAGALMCSGARAQVANMPTTIVPTVITTGNTFQTILPRIVPPSVRHSLTIEDNNASDNCWLYIGPGSATKGTAIFMVPGGSYMRYFPYVPSDVIQATCATSADTLYLDIQ